MTDPRPLTPRADEARRETLDDAAEIVRRLLGGDATEATVDVTRGGTVRIIAKRGDAVASKTVVRAR